MESTEMAEIASKIESSVEDLKYEVIGMREALQMLLNVAQEGLDELESFWYLTDSEARKTPPRAKSRNLPILGIFLVYGGCLFNPQTKPSGAFLSSYLVPHQMMT